MLASTESSGYFPSVCLCLFLLALIQGPLSYGRESMSCIIFCPLNGFGGKWRRFVTHGERGHNN